MLLSGVWLVGCTSDDGGAQPSPSEAPVVQLGGPGQSNRALTDEEIAALETPGYSETDVRFVQSMIPHHGQALGDDRAGGQRAATNTDITQMSLRMEVSQRDEIVQMEGWLRDRGEGIPSSDEHGHGSATDRPS